MSAPDVPAGLRCPGRSHTVPGALLTTPGCPLLGRCCVPCPSLGGLVMTQRNFWQYQGAALFPGRCLFLHYTFLGFFYTLIQADPGCVVSLCHLGPVCEDEELGIELPLGE